MSSPITFDRLPPFDEEAEEAVIASILVDPNAIYESVGEVEPGDFFREKNAWIFQAAIDVHGRGEITNQVVIAHELSRRGQLEDIGGNAYLSEVIRRLTTSIGCKFYARIIKRDAAYRRLIHAATGILKLAYDAPAELDEVFAKADDLLLQAQVGKPSGGMVWHRDVFPAALAEIKQHIANPTHLRGVSTGWRELDYLTDGLLKEALYIVGAETGVGKSLYAHNICNALADQGHTTAIISTEMGEKSIVRRIAYMRAEVDKIKMRIQGEYDDDALYRIERMAATSTDLPIGYFYETRLPNILAEIRRQAIQNKVEYFFIDHLADIKCPGKEGVAAVDEIVSSIAEASRRLGVHISLVAQLARVTEFNGRNRLGRLKGSGGIEQKADVVIFLEPCNDRGEKLAREDARREEKQNGGWIHMNMHVEKNRDGSEGVFFAKRDWNRGGKIVEQGR